jgi:hypothetical protein
MNIKQYFTEKKGIRGKKRRKKKPSSEQDKAEIIKKS